MENLFVVCNQIFSHIVTYTVCLTSPKTVKNFSFGNSLNWTEYLASEAFDFPASLNSVNLFCLTRHSLSWFFGNQKLLIQKDHTNLRNIRIQCMCFMLKFCIQPQLTWSFSEFLKATRWYLLLHYQCCLTLYDQHSAKLVVNWGVKWDSNSRPSRFMCSALPSELSTPCGNMAWFRTNYEYLSHTRLFFTLLLVNL